MTPQVESGSPTTNGKDEKPPPRKEKKRNAHSKRKNLLEEETGLLYIITPNELGETHGEINAHYVNKNAEPVRLEKRMYLAQPRRNSTVKEIMQSWTHQNADKIWPSMLR